MTEMRRKDRRVTDEALIDSILKECGVVRIGLYDEDRIYVVPVNYGYTYEDGRLSIYFHGGRSGHRLDCICRNPKAGFVIDTGKWSFLLRKPAISRIITIPLSEAAL